MEFQVGTRRGDYMDCNRSRAFQDFRTGIHGGPGGQHVIQQQYAASVGFRRVGPKSIFDIMPAFIPLQTGLRPGFAPPLQDISIRQTCMAAQTSGYEFTLVKASASAAFAAERHGGYKVHACRHQRRHLAGQPLSCRTHFLKF